MPAEFKTIGMIPARYGSTRFPGKPLASIGGVSLIQRTYENAKRCALLEDLVVATDDTRILEHVLEFGGNAVMTSSACPTGTERLAEAVSSNEAFSRYDMIVNIQGDEPFLETHVIETVINILADDEAAAVSTAVVKLTSEEEALSPSVNKCVMDQQGNALYFSRTLIPGGLSGKWQPDTDYYKHLGIYCYRRDFLSHYAELKPTPLQIAEDLEQLKVLEHGFRIKTAIVESSSCGIDEPEDLEKIKHLL